MKFVNAVGRFAKGFVGVVIAIPKDIKHYIDLRRM